MKIHSVRINARRKAFEIRTSARRLLIPFEQVLEYNKDPDHLRDQLVSLLQILDCDVQLVVRSKTA